MLKNELIEKLQSINGNPVVLLSDTECGCAELKGIKLKNMHQSKSEPGEYIEDYSFKGEVGYNTYYHENYNEEIEECILLTLYQ